MRGGTRRLRSVILSQMITGSKIQVPLYFKCIEILNNLIITMINAIFVYIFQMLMDPMGGIVMTNDGNAILREITVEHPAAKSMIEIARTQDEEVGDGTTSVIILGKDFTNCSTQLNEN